ncbi:MAG: response regulator [Deltaproteobacteria bacterium]|nr:response regulator [Deltaproteobacteria bacterium]
MTVLIVDDEIDQLQTLRRGLKAKGYGVLTALGVDEALAAITRHGDAIDVVLSDYQMPKKNGAYLFRELRVRKSNLPFVLMTAYAGSIPGVISLLEECDGFIEKPYTLEQIISGIETAVQRKRGN